MSLLTPRLSVVCLLSSSCRPGLIVMSSLKLMVITNVLHICFVYLGQHFLFPHLVFSSCVFSWVSMPIASVFAQIVMFFLQTYKTAKLAFNTSTHYGSQIKQGATSFSNYIKTHPNARPSSHTRKLHTLYSLFLWINLIKCKANIWNKDLTFFLIANLNTIKIF